MAGRQKWSEVRRERSPEAQVRIAAMKAEMVHEMSLAELRQARERTQTQLAAALETTQPGISRLEHQADLYVSTLRSYVEALGGELQVKAIFPEDEVAIRSFEGIAESSPASR